MKKILSVLLTVTVLSITATACGDNSTETSSQQEADADSLLVTKKLFTDAVIKSYTYIDDDDIEAGFLAGLNDYFNLLPVQKQLNQEYIIH